MVSKSGQTHPDTLVPGKTIKPMVTEPWSMLMAMSTKANGLMTKPTVRELTSTPMVPLTLEIGTKTSSTAKE